MGFSINIQVAFEEKNAMATSVYLTSISKVTFQLFTLYYQLLSFFIYHAFGLRQGGIIFYLEHRGCELSPSASSSVRQLSSVLERGDTLTYCEVVHGLEPLIGELQEEA